MDHQSSPIHNRTPFPDAPRPHTNLPFERKFIGFDSVPTFNGTESHDDCCQWLETLDRVAELYGWDEARKLKVARCKLAHHARVWERTTRSKLSTWQAFRDQLEHRFGVSEAVLHQRLAECHQHPHETANNYVDRFMWLCNRLNINTKQGKALLASFMRGLDSVMYKQVYPLRP